MVKNVAWSPGSMATDTIMRMLMIPEFRLLNKHLKDINTANKLKLKSQFDGFIYDGNFEVPLHNDNRLSPKQFNSLSPELFDQMEALKKLRRDSELIRAKIHRVLYTILKDCNSVQDVRDALPEHLWTYYKPEAEKVYMKHNLANVERMRPELYPILSDPTTMQHYRSVEGQIAVMMVGNLMY